MGRLNRSLLVAAFVAMGLLGATVPAARAADFATFGSPTSSGSLGKDVTFRQPVTVDGPIGRAELLITFADAPGPTVIEIVPPSGVKRWHR